MSIPDCVLGIWLSIVITIILMLLISWAMKEGSKDE